MPPRLTPETIAAAIAGFELQKEHIDSQIAELRTMMTGSSAAPAGSAGRGRRKRGSMSAEGRARIAEAQRKRWAAIKGDTESSTGTAKSKTAKPKRRLSAAGRKAIIEATKRRWALQRAQEAAAAKKSAPGKKAAKKSASKKSATKKSAGSAETSSTPTAG